MTSESKHGTPMTIDPKPDNSGNKLSEELVEMVSDIEHEQWMLWAKTMLASETLSEGRKQRWESLFIPYSELGEADKEQDREWARKVISVATPVIEGPLLAKINAMLEKEGALPDMVNVEMMEENIALKAEIARLREALEALWYAKQIKDRDGKSPAYESLKNAAWNQCEQALTPVKPEM